MDQKWSPEEIRAAIGAVPGEQPGQSITTDGAEDLIQAQMNKAKYLNGLKPAHHITGWGAALGGAGDVLNALNAHLTEKDALTKMAALRAAQLQNNQVVADHILNGRPPAAPEQAPVGDYD